MEINPTDKYLKSVLGTYNYDLVQNFFTSLKDIRAQYKVCLNQNSIKLAYMFNTTEGIYTADYLLSQCSDIARHYQKFKYFPKILLLTDVILYGRSINDFIDTFLSHVHKELRAGECNTDMGIVTRDVLNSLQIKAIVRCDKPLLLRHIYYACLQECPIWAMHRVNDLVPMLLQIETEGTCHDVIQCKCGSADIAPRLQSLGFIQYTNRQRYTRDVWLKPINTSSGSPGAYYVYRVIESAVDGAHYIAPMLLFTELDSNRLGDISVKVIEYCMLALLGLQPNPALLACSFGDNSLPTLSWEELTKIIMPLRSFAVDTRQSLLSVFSEAQITEDKEAWTTCSGYGRMMYGYQYHPVAELTHIADLVRYIDCDLIQTKVVRVKNTVTCVWCIGSQARFILPMQIKKYLSLLAELEHKCMRNVVDMSRVLRSRYNSELAQKLCDFVRHVYDAGMLLSDYDINPESWVVHNPERRSILSLSL